MRRPGDVLMQFLFGLFLVIWATVNVESISTWAQALTELLVPASPSWVILLLEVGYATSLIYVVVVFGALVARRAERAATCALRRRRLQAQLRGVLVVISRSSSTTPRRSSSPRSVLEDPTPRLPVLRVGMVTAISRGDWSPRHSTLSDVSAGLP